MVLSFTAGSPNQKASFESNNSNPFKQVVILVNHPVGHCPKLVGKAELCNHRARDSHATLDVARHFQRYLIEVQRDEQSDIEGRYATIKNKAA
jgi:hypothetical protein